MCQAGNPDDLYEDLTAFVKAYVDIWASAYSSCVGTGGDPDYDGGCALGKAYTGA
jgi:hypothetical protein